MERKTTELGKSYWNETGAYQEEYSNLWNDLVPSSGSADTIHGELIRAAGRLFYEYCNNGNCNALDSTYRSCGHCGGDGEELDGYEDDGEEIYGTCSWCDGTGEDEGDVYVTSMYHGFIDLIEDNVPDAPTQELRDFLLDPSLGYSSYKFTDEEMKVYNDLVDSVIYHILTTENSPYTGSDRLGLVG